MNLDIPSSETVARSRKERTYDGSHISGGKPDGLKPHIVITIQELEQGVAVTGCEACIMLRNALALTYGGTLEGVHEISCNGSPTNTLRVTSKLFTQEGVMLYENFELYTHAGKLNHSPSTLRPHCASLLLFTLA
jgi:hypothetical protein